MLLGAWTVDAKQPSVQQEDKWPQCPATDVDGDAANNGHETYLLFCTVALMPRW